jgi:hypothetical protein
MLLGLRRKPACFSFPKKRSSRLRYQAKSAGNDVRVRCAAIRAKLRAGAAAGGEVKSPKQAIGPSKARKKGKKVAKSDQRKRKVVLNDGMG